MPTSPSLRTPIAFLTPSHGGFTRALLAGVQRFDLEHPGWTCRDFLCDRRGLAEMRAWSPAGVLAHLTQPRAVEAVRGMDVPVVNTSSAQDVPGVARVGVDNEAVGRLAAEHLMDRGFRDLAFLGRRERLTSSLRWQGFSQAAERRGVRAQAYEGDTPPFGRGRGGRPTRAEARVIAWLGRLPEPAGLLAWTDDAAVAAIQWAGEASIAVPEALAVVGVNNSQPFGTIPLTSVSLPIDAMGYASAALLDDILAGRREADATVLFQPTHVEPRASTDAVAVEDSVLRRAVAYLREAAHEPITVDDVAEHVGVGRRVLERRFREHLNQSVLEELHAQKLRLVRTMLVETQLSVTRIAHACGFGSPLHLRRVFRKRHDCTPADYRERARRGE